MDKSFDYIVIGAGTAGCALAGRLSESGEHRVLLLEAGGNENRFWVEMPLGFGRLYNRKRGNWAYESEPEEGLFGAKSYQPRGKRLGGTGAINGAVYMRGRRDDYDSWEKLGCPGWSYEDVLPYFRKSEDNERGESRYHGVGGPVAVIDTPHSELGDAFLAAAEAAGHRRTVDHAGSEHEGFGYAQLTACNGRRSYSGGGFLTTARRRANFEVLAHALVTRIVVEKGRAVAVEYSTRSGKSRVNARKEIILCAGAFNSPQLLQLSGIGPARLLASLGIPVVADRPGVGENLQDHFGVSVVCACTKPITISAIVANPFRLGLALLQYIFLKKGIFTTNGNICNGYIRGARNAARADSAIALVNWARAPVGRANKGLGLLKRSAFTLTVALLQPKSRGSVRLRSADPADAPEIRFNFFKSAEDHDALVGAVQQARNILSKAPVDSYVEREMLPGNEIRTPDQILDYCKRYGRSTHHAAGTCKMGSDEMAVVDPRLRVIGVEGLRVADASIMPLMVCGNTNAPTMMIAEKAAAMILEDAGSLGSGRTSH
jgi:choline dehydrogenase